MARVWSWLRGHRIAVGSLGLVAVLVVGCGYLARSVLRFDPFRETYTVTVELESSGGILPENDVTFRGIRVGRVTAVDLADSGVRVVAEINSSARIPNDGKVVVARLSAAGEQYLDFRPDSAAGPYLGDGSVVERSRTEFPVTVGAVLTNVSGLIGGLNPQRLRVVIDELDIALGGGPDRLRSVVSGISLAIAGADDLLPQTHQLIENLQVIARTTALAQPDLATLTQSSTTLFQQMTAADQEVRRLLDLAPGHLATLGGVIEETSDPLTNLATNFSAVARAAQLRTPALTALLPGLREFAEAIGVPLHNNAFNTYVDIWPRPTCDYPTVPAVPTTKTADTRIRLYNYCVTDNPALQVRGSANAPRPNVPDNGAGMPPGVTGNELSQPLPGR